MQLVEDENYPNPNYIVFTGEGKTELNVMKGLAHVYNGRDIILHFPLSTLSRRTGLTALKSIKTTSKYYNSMIYIVDGDVFDNIPINEIQDYLKGIGIKINDVKLIREAFLINCEKGDKVINLYCIISGQTFIEEEIACLIKLKWGIDIDITGIRDIPWKKRIKREVNQVLKEKNIRIESLIKETGKKKLEIAFPNFCAVLKKIEEDYSKN